MHQMTTHFFDNRRLQIKKCVEIGTFCKHPIFYTHPPTHPCMCLTLPMGFAHAVFLANTGHEHILYSSLALRPEDNLLRLACSIVTADRVKICAIAVALKVTSKNYWARLCFPLLNFFVFPSPLLVPYCFCLSAFSIA
jgi:hypothetical protein